MSQMRSGGQSCDAEHRHRGSAPSIVNRLRERNTCGELLKIVGDRLAQVPPKCPRTQKSPGLAARGFLLKR
jgi:hypothetical protein